MRSCRRARRVLVAVSGGSDSVALLLLLLDVAGGCGFTVAGVAHVNHGLRGAASDGDEAFCRRSRQGSAWPSRLAAATWHGSRHTGGSRSRSRRATRGTSSWRRWPRRCEADTIATGHTRDDQAETFLLRLLRGAGATGLSGIRPRRGRIVRPLLDIRRDELRRYSPERRQAFRDGLDQRGHERSRATGCATACCRCWRAQLNADIVEVLAREAAVLRDEAALLDELAHETASRLIEKPATAPSALEAARPRGARPGARAAGRSPGARPAGVRPVPRLRPRRAGAGRRQGGSRPGRGRPSGRPRGTKWRKRCLI